MGANVENTIREMQELAEHHDTVAVGYSGGKDSMVTLDLALRFFPKVYPYFLYLVPDLHQDQRVFDYCKQRFGLEVLKFPDWHFINAVHNMSYCDYNEELAVEDALLDERKLFDWIKAETGATLLMNGQKKADGAFRRRYIANTKKTQQDVYRPLKNWLRWEVLSYLKMRDLPVKEGSAADNSGIGLHTTEVLYLYDNERHDYELLKTYFPYIEVIVKRREWFGVTE